MLDADLHPLCHERVRLRPLSFGDAVAFAEGSADPDVRRYGHLPEPVYTPESVRSMIEREVLPGLARGDLAVLAVADIERDEFLGSVVLFDVTDRRAEVGFWVHPAHRGSGVTAAGLALAARFASGSGLSELTARTMPENAASHRVLVAAGFVCRGRGTDTAPSGRTAEVLYFSRPVAGDVAGTP